MSEELTDDQIATIEARNAVRRVLRTTFGTAPGKRALTHILRECKFFQRAVTAELERKRRLGHYYVSRENGQAAFAGPDAPQPGP